jgi:hypothetical protein
MVGFSSQCHRVSLVKAILMTPSMTPKCQLRNLTSGQGHELTYPGHMTYGSKRIDKRKALVIFSSLVHLYISSYQTKTALDLKK